MKGVPLDPSIHRGVRVLIGVTMNDYFIGPLPCRCSEGDGRWVNCFGSTSKRSDSRSCGRGMPACSLLEPLLCADLPDGEGAPGFSSDCVEGWGWNGGDGLTFCSGWVRPPREHSGRGCCGIMMK